MSLRYRTVQLNGFTHDPDAQRHARRWAANYYNEDTADLFVAWLLTMPDDYQERIYIEGYPKAAADFEIDYPDIRS